MGNPAEFAITVADVQRARQRIAGLVRPTPVVHSPWLSGVAGAEVWLKLENLQPAGSFKIRGAASKLFSLPAGQRARGVITSSGGNHGAAVGYVARALGIPATICVPENVDPAKLAVIRDSGAEAMVSGATFDEALALSRQLEQERGLCYVHPFDDPEVIAGQGTIGLELLDQIPGLTMVAAAVSGGGLAGGIGLAVSGARPPGNAGQPAVQVVGVSAERAATMAASVQAGHPVELGYASTIAEVLTGGIGLDNRWSFAAVQRFVHAHVLVTEDEIAAAMRAIIGRLHLVAEGAGAVPVAAALAGKLPPAAAAGGPVALVISGGNIDAGALRAFC